MAWEQGHSTTISSIVHRSIGTVELWRSRVRGGKMGERQKTANKSELIGCESSVEVDCMLMRKVIEANGHVKETSRQQVYTVINVYEFGK